MQTGFGIQQARFTPAHAGNTWTAMKALEVRKVHPRSRGEYDFTEAVNAFIEKRMPVYNQK